MITAPINPIWTSTTYNKKNSGICLSENEKNSLPNGKFRVFINSSLKKGNLNLAEAKLNGKTKKEIFFSTNICHPSMANNELSGPVLLSALIKYIKDFHKNNYYSYRFIFTPETIGSIAYLSKNYKKMKKNIITGFTLSCVGDERSFSHVVSSSYKLADKALSSALIGYFVINLLLAMLSKRRFHYFSLYCISLSIISHILLAR